MKIKAGDIITLKDEQEIAASIEAGRGAEGYDYEIQDVETYYFDGVVFSLCKLTEETSLLVDNSRPSLFALASMIEPGTVREMVANDNRWLFNEPEDVNSVVYSDLEAASTIESDDGTVYTKIQSVDGERTDGTFAMLSTYESDESRAYIIETGGIDEDGKPTPDGCFVRFFVGNGIASSDISHLPTSED